MTPIQLCRLALTKSAEEDIGPVVKSLQQTAQNAAGNPAIIAARNQGAGWGGLIGAGIGTGGGLLASYLLNRKAPKAERRRKMWGSAAMGLGLGGLAGASLGGNFTENNQWYRDTGLQGISRSQAARDPEALAKAVRTTMESARKTIPAEAYLRGVAPYNMAAGQIDTGKALVAPVLNYLNGKSSS